MPPRLKLHDLRKILRSYDVGCDERRGKGSHLLFFRQFPDGRYTYPVPKETEVKPCYVKACRRRFRLMPEDGVTDAEFYSR